MTWRNQFFVALLGGVPIRYREVTTTPGWRQAVHEYYGTRPPTVESIGPSPWRAVIDCYLIGDNYLEEKQRLIDVIDSPGPWEFIHPTAGPFMVKLERPPELRESVSEQGMVRIGQLALIEAGFSYPQVFDATSRKLAALATEAATVMARTTRLSWLGAIDKVLDSIKGAINKATARVSKVNGRIGAVTGDLYGIQAAINNLDEQRDYLAQAPWQILGGIIGVGMAAWNALGKFEPARRTITVDEPEWGAVEAANGSIRDLASFETAPDDITAGAPSGSQVELAQAAHAEVQLQMQTLAYTGAASIAGDLPYTSASQASAMMVTIKNGLAATMADPGLSTLAYEALAELRTTVIRHLLEVQAQLPRIVAVPVPTAMPALVLAYEIHGSAARASELVGRNRVGNPNRVSGTLEVVVDG